MLKLETIRLPSPPLGERIRPTQQVSLPTDPAGPGRSAEMGSSPRGAVAGNQESVTLTDCPGGVTPFSIPSQSNEGGKLSRPDAERPVRP